MKSVIKVSEAVYKVVLLIPCVCKPGFLTTVATNIMPSLSRYIVHNNECT